jgi:hypothetical protein
MPSFATASPLDYKIKKAVVYDSINLLNLSLKRKQRLKAQKKQELQKRLLKPQNINQKALDQIRKDRELKEKPRTDEEHVNEALMDRSTWKSHLKEERNERLARKRLAREKFEKEHCGGYRLIYPFVSYAEEDMISARVDKLLLEKPGDDDTFSNNEAGKIKDCEQRALNQLDNELSDQQGQQSNEDGTTTG